MVIDMPCTTHHKACDCREAEFAKLREQNHRLKAAIQRAKGCQQVWGHTEEDSAWFLTVKDVFKALRLRK